MPKCDWGSKTVYRCNADAPHEFYDDKADRTLYVCDDHEPLAARLWEGWQDEADA